jgi:predicted dehydrogenase
MRLLVIGTGSIGKRHISNLLDLGAEVQYFSYRPDTQPIDARAKRISSIEAALGSNIDAVVVANRTDQHVPVALEAARRGIHLFVEKPLSGSLVGVEELISTVKLRGLVVEAGFMMRAHPNLCWIRKQLGLGIIGDIWHMRAAVGQWLPDWRRDTDYRQSYSASRLQGGGVTLDLIHELDLVQWLLGPVIEVTAMMRKVKALEIETEAIAQIGLQLASGALAQVHLDYLRPGYGREMELVGSSGVLRWDYTRGVVTLEQVGHPLQEVHHVPDDFARNHLFLSHMRHFLNCVHSKTLRPISPIIDSADVLKVALAAHRSAEERTHVLVQKSFIPTLSSHNTST